jgi:tRNA (guanine10-N2)-dimethyltransferase
MKYAFLLSKEDLKLAKHEVLSLLNTKSLKLIDNLLFLESNNIKSANRLAYTKKVYQLLFETDKKNLINKIKDFNWQNIYKKDFCVKIHKLDNTPTRDKQGRETLNLQSKFMASSNGTNIKEKDLASKIWKTLTKPKVNLKNPKTSIEFFIIDNKIYSVKLVKELKQNFLARKPHKRPELHPTGLHPKLARALINLAGAEKEIMDPFCGVGGILIEAGLMDIKPIGYDLYKIMIDKAKTNLKHFKIKNYKLINEDALKIKKKYNYIVTDPPYGMNTSIWIRKGNKNEKLPINQTNKKQNLKQLEDFYLKFLKVLKKILKKKAVVIFPHYVNYKKLIRKVNLKIEKEFEQYIHGSLTRKIIILS